MPTDESPYAQRAECEHPGAIVVDDAELSRIAKRKVRLVVLFGVAYLWIDAILWVPYGLGIIEEARQDFPGDLEHHATLMSAFLETTARKFVLAVSVTAVGMLCCYSLIRIVAEVIRWMCVSWVPRSQWMAATDRATFPLPYGAFAGAVLWYGYCEMFPYGWLSDVISGTIGVILGAWAVFVILLAWFRVARASTR